ncbi:2-iminoacetate synthase [compost metagenome]
MNKWLTGIAEARDPQMREALDSRLHKQQELFAAASTKRDSTIGNKLLVRGSLEYSNICANSCSFCGMTVRNRELNRYTVSESDARKAISLMARMGIKQLHIVSGEDRSQPIRPVVEMIQYAGELGIHTTVVLGERLEREYRELYDAGASRYILKIETSNPEVYYRSKGRKSLKDRIDHLMRLRDIGFKIGTGVIVGLPGTTLEDVVNDIKLIREIDPDMASVSVFSPNKQSDYRDYPPGDVDTALNLIALLRLVLRDDVLIPIGTSFAQRQAEGLLAGANVVSHHSTPEQHIDDFSAYRASSRLKTGYDRIVSLADSANMAVSEYI